MSGTGIGGGANAGGGSSGNLPGGHAPGSAPMVNPTLAEVATLVDWFGHPNNNIFDGMALTSLPVNLINCSPVVTKAALISLKPTAPLAFFGLFLSVSTPQGLMHLLMFPGACPCIFGTPSPSLCLFQQSCGQFQSYSGVS